MTVSFGPTSYLIDIDEEVRLSARRHNSVSREASPTMRS